MNLVLAVSGATGAYAARLVMEKSPWPVALVASRWGREVYQRECGDFERLVGMAARVYDNEDLSSAIASGSVPTIGMVVLPCSCDCLAKTACGLGDTLITRAAQCHLKERRKLVLCVRESPWSLLDLENARRAAAAGAIVMPMAPPYYIGAGRDPADVTMAELLSAYVDRVLAVLGHFSGPTWETMS